MEQWHGESSNLSREFVVKHVSSSVRGHSTAAGLPVQLKTQVQVADLTPGAPICLPRGSGMLGRTLVVPCRAWVMDALLLHVYGWEGW